MPIRIKKLYRPASIEKVITSVTALAELREYYLFNTRIAYTGTIVQDSILQGDLYLSVDSIQSLWMRI